MHNSKSSFNINIQNNWKYAMHLMFIATVCYPSRVLGWHFHLPLLVWVTYPAEKKRSSQVLTSSYPARPAYDQLDRLNFQAGQARVCGFYSRADIRRYLLVIAPQVGATLKTHKSIFLNMLLPLFSGGLHDLSIQGLDITCRLGCFSHWLFYPPSQAMLQPVMHHTVGPLVAERFRTVTAGLTITMIIR